MEPSEISSMELISDSPLSSTTSHTYSWMKKPIMIGSHAFEDKYKSSDFAVNKPGTFDIILKGEDGSEEKI
jgi:hypothetical protein